MKNPALCETRDLGSDSEQKSECDARARARRAERKYFRAPSCPAIVQFVSACEWTRHKCLTYYFASLSPFPILLSSASRFQILEWYRPCTQGEYEDMTTIAVAVAVVAVIVIIVVIRSSRESARYLAR